MKPDPVERPPHYTVGEIECIDAIRAALGPYGFQSFCQGQVMKYIWRARHKEKFKEDMKKAAWYARMAAGDDPREASASERARAICEDYEHVVHTQQFRAVVLNQIQLAERAARDAAYERCAALAEKYDARDRRDDKICGSPVVFSAGIVAAEFRKWIGEPTPTPEETEE